MIVFDKFGTERNVIAFANRYNIDKKHPEAVAKYSMILFDALKPVHKMGNSEKKLLKYAAILHDIGYFISSKSHHKNALKMLLEFPDLILSRRNKILVGLIARYHRKSFPKDTHEFFSEIGLKEKRMVRVLASILRLADGFDYGHRTIIKSFEVASNSQVVIITAFSAASAGVECEKAREKCNLFETLFRKKIVINNTILQ